MSWPQLLKHHKILWASDPNGWLWQFTAACLLFCLSFSQANACSCAPEKKHLVWEQGVTFCALPSTWVKTDKMKSLARNIPILYVLMGWSLFLQSNNFQQNWLMAVSREKKKKKVELLGKNRRRLWATRSNKWLYTVASCRDCERLLMAVKTK